MTDNLQSDGAGGYYVNMLKTGAKEVSLVEHTSTKVYDDGGSAAHFSRNADGTLLLTAAAGTVIRLTGTIDVADVTQILTVYDGATTADALLGTFTNTDGVVNVVSTGTQMLLRFVTGSTGTDNGLNLKATAVSSASRVTLTDGNGVTALSAFAGQLCDVSYERSFTSGKPSTVCLPFAYENNGTASTFYTFTGITKNGSDYEATMTEYTGSTLVANTPYLFMPTTSDVDFSGAYTLPASITAGTTTSGDWTYVGTYTEQKWKEAPTGIYGFSAQDVGEDISQGQFVKVGAYVRVKPMRCYLKYKNGGEDYAGARAMNRAAAADEQLPETIIVRLIGANDEMTAIGTLHTQTSEVVLDGWYTLDGRRLSGKPTVPGIYVRSTSDYVQGKNNGKKYIIK